MKIKKALPCCLLLAMLMPVNTAYAQAWPAIHTETRPATRWWWLNGAVKLIPVNYE